MSTELLKTLTNLTNIPTTIDLLSNGKAKFTDVDDESPKPINGTLLAVSTAISILIYIAIGVLCVYLSWKCNTNQCYNVAAKAIFAFFAWNFGLIYLIYYGLFRAGTCAPRKCKKL
jgi:hypothetical protein